MDLHQEYYVRKKLTHPFVKYACDTHLLLKKLEDSSLYRLHLQMKCPTNHPPTFQLQMYDAAKIYCDNDFVHFSCHETKVIELLWQWEEYEDALMNFSKDYLHGFTAIPYSDILFNCWHVFLTNSERWLSKTLPYNQVLNIHHSLCALPSERLNLIQIVEEWFGKHNKKMAGCWNQIKGTWERKYYGDWLLQLINSK